jgi:hypothetical protein
MSRQGFRVKSVHFISKIHEQLVCQYAANPKIVLIGIPFYPIYLAVHNKNADLQLIANRNLSSEKVKNN